MATTASAADWVEALRASELLDEDRLQELSKELGRFADAGSCAEELVQRGWLTSWQAEQLLNDKQTRFILGQYLLLELLGEGGMGQVFKARHRLMNRIVALKVIRKEQLNSPTAVNRFHREIQLAAQLSHPNVVIAHDADHVGDTHYFVMEYVEGMDLGQLLKERGPLPVPEACDYIRQAALGLQHAFERGLIHRDIKPSNLFLALDKGNARRFGVVKILDMGLARIQETDDTASVLTHAGAIIGTPDFMAPEQAQNSHAVDIRADIYSLGCSLYGLLVGQVPFPGGTLTEKLFKHVYEEPAAITESRSDVPQALLDVLNRMMAKAQEERYQTPAEVAAALEPFCQLEATAPSLTASTQPNAEPLTAVTRVLPRKASTGRVPVLKRTATEALSNPSQQPTTRREPHLVPDHALATADLPPPASTGSATIPDRPKRGKSRRLLMAVGGVLLGLGLATAVIFGLEKVSTTGTSTEVAVAPPPSNSASTGTLPQATRPAIDKGKTPDVAPPPPAQPDRHAYLIGVQRNQANELVPFPYADADLAKLAESLRSAGYRPPNVTLLADADGKSMRRELKTELGKRLPGDSVLVALAGHVVQFVGSDEVYFCPADARLGNRQSLLSFTEIYNDLKECKAEFKLVLADVCRRNLLAPLAPAEIKIEPVCRPQKIPPPAGVAVVFSCSAGEAGYDRSDLRHGIFFHFWQQAVQRAVVNAEDFTARQVFAEVVNHFQKPNVRQTPVRLGATGGDARFAPLESFAGPEPVGAIFSSAKDGHLEGVTTVAISPDGLRALSGSYDTNLRLWDLLEKKQSNVWEPGVETVVWSVAFAPDGRYAVVGTGGAKKDGKLVAGTMDHNAVRLFQLPFGNESAVKGQKDFILSVAYGPDSNTVVSGGYDGLVRLWQLQGSSLKETILTKKHSGRVRCVAMAPDGKRALSGGDDGMVVLWDLDSKKPIGEYKHDKPVRCVAFSPDPERPCFLAGGDDRAVTVYDGKGKKTASFTRHEDAVLGAAFSPDGRWAISGGADKIVRLWDAATGKEIHPFKGHTGPVTSVAFAPDGRRALSGSEDTTIRLWALPRVEK